MALKLAKKQALHNPCATAMEAACCGLGPAFISRELQKYQLPPISQAEDVEIGKIAPQPRRTNRAGPAIMETNNQSMMDSKQIRKAAEIQQSTAPPTYSETRNYIPL